MTKESAELQALKTQAISILGDEAAAKEWLEKPLLLLGGKSASEMVRDEEERHKAYDMLMAIKSGHFR